MTRVLKAWPRLSLVIVALLGALLVGTTAALAVSVTKTGKTVRAVKVVTESGATSTTSSTFVDMAVMSLTMTVPSGEQGLFVIEFSGSGTCTEIAPTNATAFCDVMIQVDNSAAAPPGDVVWLQAANGTSSSFHAQSFTFVSGPLNAGSHRFDVQFRSLNGSFHFADRSLMVMRTTV